MGPATGKLDPPTKSNGPRFARGSQYRGTPNPGSSPGPTTDVRERRAGEGRREERGDVQRSRMLEAGQRVRPSDGPGAGTPGGNRYDRLRVMRTDPYPNRVKPAGAGDVYTPSEARVPNPMQAGAKRSSRAAK